MMTPEATWTWTLSILLIRIFMGLMYSIINIAVPGLGTKKGVNYGFMVWLFAGAVIAIMLVMSYDPVIIQLSFLHDDLSLAD
jgi:prepilin signal peptidase PulO-like enzyme (type II secretory pathway)